MDRTVGGRWCAVAARLSSGCRESGHRCNRSAADLAANEYSEFVINNKEVEVNGDLAFARGNFKVTVAAKSGGDPMHFEGKYMTIFRQQPDGTWKIYRDIFNASAP